MTVTEMFDPAVGPATQELGSVPAPPPADLEHPDNEPDGPVPLVDVAMVRGILAGFGNMASMVDRAAPGLWKFTEDELDALAPPLTNVANRNETLRRALLHGDYVIIAMTLSGYAARNISTRRDAVNAQRHRDQISGGARGGGGLSHSGSPVGAGSGSHDGAGGGSAAHGQGGYQ